MGFFTCDRCARYNDSIASEELCGSPEMMKYETVVKIRWAFRTTVPARLNRGFPEQTPRPVISAA